MIFDLIRNQIALRAPLRPPFRVMDLTGILGFAGAVLYCSALVAQPMIGVANADRFELRSKTEVDSKGVFLNQILGQNRDESLANIRVTSAPAWGKSTTIDQRTISELVAAAAPQFASATWVGASQIQIGRASRKFEASELVSLLEAKLSPSRDVGDAGELRLALKRDWKPLSVPTDSIDLRIVTRPSAGLQQYFDVTFELLAGKESIGVYPAFLEAHLFREVWIARTAIRRLTNLDEADLIREKRDVIALKETAWDGQTLDASMRLTSALSAGGVLTAKAVAARPVILRNQSINAIARKGVLEVQARVIATEDGAVGQMIQARNDKKLIKGKVIDENTIEVDL